MQAVPCVKRLVYLPSGERIEVLVTSSKPARSVIITVPDLDENISGFRGMYDLWADYFATHAIGAVIQMPNRDEIGWGRPKAIPFQKDIVAICEYAAKVGTSITSTKKPKLYLLGFSKGDTIKEAIAAKHTAIDRIQSVAPSFSKGTNVLKKLKVDIVTFRGELKLSNQEEDEVVFSGWGKHFAPWQFVHRG